MTDAEQLAELLHDALFDLFVRDDAPDCGEEDMTDDEGALVKKRIAELVLNSVCLLYPHAEPELVVKHVASGWIERYLFHVSPELIRMIVQLCADIVGPGADAWRGWMTLTSDQIELRHVCETALLLAS